MLAAPAEDTAESAEDKPEDKKNNLTYTDSTFDSCIGERHFLIGTLKSMKTNTCKYWNCRSCRSWKDYLIQALTGSWTSVHSQELKRGITIKVGYSDAAFYKCKDCEEPLGYSTTPKCNNCNGSIWII